MESTSEVDSIYNGDVSFQRFSPSSPTETNHSRLV